MSAPSSKRWLLVTPLLIALLSQLSAQAPRLVADINQVGIPVSSSPYPATTLPKRQFIKVGLYYYFMAKDPTRGIELHRTLGVPGKTNLVADINPGIESSDVLFMAKIGTTIYFGATDGKLGNELWRLDTTTQKVSLVKDIFPGPAGSHPSHIAAFGKYLWFNANDGVHGAELWRSDGTTNGTVMVADTWPGPNSSLPLGFFEWRGIVYFLGTDGVTGAELWRSDGTASGTWLVKDINPKGHGNPQAFVPFNNELWFIATELQYGVELWKTDGTTAGTVIAHDVYPGRLPSLPSPPVLFQGQLYFTAITPGTGRELWRSNGTSFSPVELKPGKEDGAVGATVVTGKAPNEVLYFIGEARIGANKQETGRELCSWDGTKFTVFDLYPGPTGSSAMNLTEAANGQIFFRAIHPKLGNELWVTNGTVASTRLVKDINQRASTNPSLNSSGPEFLTPAFNGVLFSADDPLGAGRELWFSDGTTIGTRLIADINPNKDTGHAFPDQLYNAGGTLFFSADDGVTGREPWMSDGTTNGTQRIADLVPGSGSSTPKEFTRVGHKVFFVADAVDSVTKQNIGIELHAFDLRTKQLTTLDLLKGSAGSTPGNLVAWQGRLYFRANGDLGQSASTGKELWSSDGTLKGTHLVKDIWTGQNDSNPNYLSPYKGRLIFAASDGNIGRELWETDGTSAGTKMFVDLVPGPASSDPNYLTILGDAIVLRATGLSNGPELWLIDGKKQVTELDLRSGSVGSFPRPTRGPLPGANAQDFIVVGKLAYFVANNGTSGEELWCTDGTKAGTRMLRDINPGPGSAGIRSMAVMGNDKVAFNANDGTSGDEPWVSDGTSTGTRRLLDLQPGAGSGRPGEFAHIGSRRVGFSAFPPGQNNAIIGFELVVSDGKSSGTRIYDIWPGSTSSLPRQLEVMNGKLYFVAVHPQKKTELFSLDLGAVAQRAGSGCKANASAPALLGTDPILGASSTITVRGSAKQAGVFLLGGRPAVPLLLGRSCELYVDLTGQVGFLPFVTDASGVWQGQLNIPQNKALSGLTLASQSVLGPSSTGPLGLDFTNALLLTFGN